MLYSLARPQFWTAIGRFPPPGILHRFAPADRRRFAGAGGDDSGGAV